jgi:hypothetical protein
MSQVSVSATLKVAAEAERLRRAGHNVVDFSAGEPDFPTPEHVKSAAKAAIDDNFTRYTAAAGVPELREAVCARYKTDYGVDITPAEVLMTVGGKQALFNTALGRHARAVLADDSRAGEARRWHPRDRADPVRGGLRGEGRGHHRGDDAEDESRHPQLARQPHGRPDRRDGRGGNR